MGWRCGIWTGEVHGLSGRLHASVQKVSVIGPCVTPYRVSGPDVQPAGIITLACIAHAVFVALFCPAWRPRPLQCTEKSPGPLYQICTSCAQVDKVSCQR